MKHNERVPTVVPLSCSLPSRPTFRFQFTKILSESLQLISPRAICIGDVLALACFILPVALRNKYHCRLIERLPTVQTTCDMGRIRTHLTVSLIQVNASHQQLHRQAHLEGPISSDSSYTLFATFRFRRI